MFKRASTVNVAATRFVARKLRRASANNIDGGAKRTTGDWKNDIFSRSDVLGAKAT